MQRLRFCATFLSCSIFVNTGGALTPSPYRLIKPFIVSPIIKSSKTTHFFSMMEQGEPSNDVEKWEMMYE
jgi:hypothetical protein